MIIFFFQCNDCHTSRTHYTKNKQTNKQTKHLKVDDQISVRETVKKNTPKNVPLIKHAGVSHFT